MDILFIDLADRGWIQGKGQLGQSPPKNSVAPPASCPGGVKIPPPQFNKSLSTVFLTSKIYPILTSDEKFIFYLIMIKMMLFLYSLYSHTYDENIQFWSLMRS